MTDKEKAEEYIINKYYKDWLEEESREVILEDVHNFDKKEMEGFLAGLTEGRKEEQEKTCYCKHIQNFEKENAELLDKLNLQNQRLNELKKENAELKKQIQIDTEIIIGEQQEINELQKKIEKMQKDQKTAFIKGMRHFAKAMKVYDREEGAWTDYFEHAVDEVLKNENEKLKQQLKFKQEYVE